MRPHIEKLVVKNYGCLKDVQVDLTPLHCFIGPNDSGKSTLLDAVQTLTKSANQPQGTDFEFGWPALGYVEKAPASLECSTVLAMNSNKFHRWTFLSNETSLAETGWTETPAMPMHNQNVENRQGGIVSIIDNLTQFISAVGGDDEAEQFIHSYKSLADSLRGVRLVRLTLDALRKPSQLIPDGQEIGFGTEQGDRLAGIYDALINQNVQGFLDICKNIGDFFPTIKQIQLKNVSVHQKLIQAKLSNGKTILATQMSAGLLFYLAFAALPYLTPTALVLVEEPENGLHPARIAEVVRILRKVSETSQVLIATHSPLVVNQLAPEEVSVVTRDVEKGTIVRPITQSHDFDIRKKIYALGELWLSYADGDAEGPLFGEGDDEP